MKSSLKISSVFPKHLFWDIDMEQLDAERDKDLIIPRALYMSDSTTFNNDISKLETFYSAADIIRYLKTTKELISNNVCELVAERYHVPTFHRFSHQ